VATDRRIPMMWSAVIAVVQRHKRESEAFDLLDQIGP
jgi:hypothetical protein